MEPEEARVFPDRREGDRAEQRAEARTGFEGEVPLRGKGGGLGLGLGRRGLMGLRQVAMVRARPDRAPAKSLC